jgi:DNA polymerase-4
VGPVTARTLPERGITTVGDVARIAGPALEAMLGQAAGRHLHALAHNQDPRAVQVGRRRKSIGSQRALARAPRSAADIDVILLGLVDQVTRRLRDGGRVGRTVMLRLRFGDFTSVTRSHSLSRATANTEAILAEVRTLVTAAMPAIEERGLTLIGIAVGNLDDDDAVQMGLPFDGPDNDALDTALDGLRERFGSGAVTRAALLGRPTGPSVPILPD